VDAHRRVGVEVAAGIFAIGADPADFRRQVENDIWLRIPIEPLDGVLPRQVVVLAAGDEEVVVAEALELLDDKRAQKPGAAGDEAL
jgi:hypothetical protein